MAHFKKYKILQLSYLEIDAKKCFNLLFEKFSKNLFLRCPRRKRTRNTLEES